MEIIIREIDETNQSDANRVDSSFTVVSRLALRVEDGSITYTIVPAPPYRKSYPPDEIDPSACMYNPDYVMYLAYVDGQLAGQVVIGPRWNGYAYLEDIRVDPHFRRGGVGRALMAQAITWARARGKPGIMLETQDVNVGACQFYERCGFVLGGLDHYVYRNFPENKDEIGLYWYLLFDSPPVS